MDVGVAAARHGRRGRTISDERSRSTVGVFFLFLVVHFVVIRRAQLCFRATAAQQ